MACKLSKILFGIMSCSAALALHADTTTPAKLPDDWYKAVFEVQFPPQIPGLPPAQGNVVLHQTKIDLAGQAYPELFRPMPAELGEAITAADTVNPFRSSFTPLYEEHNARKRARCPALAATFELDDNPQTQEWVVSFSALQCLADDPSLALRSGDTEPHQWVVQRLANGKFRILAESDGMIHIINRNKEDGYKEIHTRLAVKRSFPNNELQCGAAELTWQYRNGSYKIAAREYLAQECASLYFPALSGEAKAIAYAEYERRIKALVEEWEAQLGQ